MKKKLLLGLLVATGSLFAQQTIGEFPIMDGGLESQTAGNLSSQGSSANNSASLTWSISSTGGTTDEIIADDADVARSGSFYAQAQLNTDKDNARLQVPSSADLKASTKYTIQWFYNSPVAVDNANLKGGIYLNNTSGGKTSDKTDVDTFVANTWLKAHSTVTSGADINVSNWAVVRIGGEKEVVKPLIKFDDFVVYGGDYDDVAPGAPTVGTLDAGSVAWTAPVDGVDGGGYVVVSYATEPEATDDVNQNGIYQVGSAVAGNGTVVYIGTETTFSETYVEGTYYKVYAVDKAFNYSDELVITEDSGLASTDDVFASTLSVYPNPASGMVTVDSKETVLTSVELFNTVGTLVYSSEETNSIDVSSFAKGVYFLKLNADGASATKKLIVE